MNIKCVLATTLIALFCLMGCKNEAQLIQSENMQPTESTNTEIVESILPIATEEKEPEILHYVDAFGELHETVIREDVEKHPYDLTLLTKENDRFTYTGEGYELRHGIDVSHYQGNIDWQKIREQGFDFVIIRAGFRGYGENGVIKEDNRFESYYKGAKEAGLMVGVYFFAQAVSEEEAVEEAEFVLSLLKDKELELPVVYDPELIRDEEARTDNVTGEQFTANTIAFCERIKEAGYEAMVYSNMIWEAELFDLAQLEAYPIWYADYEPLPQTPYRFTFWQYSETGRVAGIDGYVDLDVWFVPSENGD